MTQRNEKSMGTDERPEPNAESGSSTSPARGDIVDTFWDYLLSRLTRTQAALRRVTATVLVLLRRILMAVPLPFPMLRRALSRLSKMTLRRCRFLRRFLKPSRNVIVPQTI